MWSTIVNTWAVALLKSSEIHMKYVLVLLCFATMAIMVSAEPSPRRVLNLPQAKDNPRNGEGAGERK